MNVLDLLEEIENIVEAAPSVPLTTKIMIDGQALLGIVSDIRKSLPDDVHQARWVREQKERILMESRQECDRIIAEAKEQASCLVENDEITMRARKKAELIEGKTEKYASELKMRTFDYVDSILFEMQNRVDYLELKYFSEMYSNLEKYFKNINEVLQSNRDEIKDMAYRTKNGEDVPITAIDELIGEAQ